MKRLLLLLFLVNFTLFSVQAQKDRGNKLSRKDKKNYQEADYLLDNGNFFDAIPIYLDLIGKIPDKPDINFKLGYCYLNTALEKAKSLQYLKKAVDLFTEDEKKLLQARFYLAESYHINYKFEEALELISTLSSMEGLSEEQQTRIQHLKAACTNGIDLVASPLNMIIFNLGSQVNSPFSDHSPVISTDESTLIFTSRRKAKGGKMPDGQYVENIYVSKKENGEWGEASSISKKINTETHEATIGLSPDGNMLFIYKNNAKNEKDGNIYVSQFDGSDWSVPQKLGENVNTKLRESHASITGDGNYLYFSSNREGGLGGMDIYVSRREGSSWGLPVNLGPAINTPYDEESPHIDAEDETLYFSSKGHNSMGGYDIFMTIKNGTTWSEPSNLGYPVNTTADDLFYVPNADGKRSYYSSHKVGGMGETDIYVAALATRVKGTISMDDGMSPSAAQISILDAGSENFLAEKTFDSVSGEFSFLLMPGENYIFHCEADGYYPFDKKLRFEDYVGNEIFELDVALESIKLPEDKTYKIKYVNNSISDDSRTSEHIANLLDELNNAQAIVSLSAFTVPGEEARAAEHLSHFTSFLVEKGIDASRIFSTVPTGNLDNGLITVMLLEDYEPKTVLVYDMLFSAKSARLPADKTNLDKLAEYLIDNPNAKVNLVGHGDMSEGGARAASHYASLRATGVKKYLVSKGVATASLLFSSRGAEVPIADSRNNSDAAKYNTRLEFKVLRQGNDLLKIKRINVPKDVLLSTPEEVLAVAAGATVRMPDDLFTIQLGAFSHTVTKSYYRELDNYKMYSGNDGVLRYVTGEYDTREEAEAELSRLSEKGFTDCVVKRKSTLKKLSYAFQIFKQN